MSVPLCCSCACDLCCVKVKEDGYENTDTIDQGGSGKAA